MAIMEWEWSAWDSMQCWNVLAAMWAAKEFTSCLKQGEVIPTQRGNLEGESMFLCWNGDEGEFNSCSKPGTTN